jgi:hypothetical protein
MNMVERIKCPHCGNEDIEQIRYTEEQVMEADYRLKRLKDGTIAADLTHRLSSDWDVEVVKKSLCCLKCVERFDDPGIQTIS